MPKIPRKRSIQQYWNALVYMDASLNFHPDTRELVSEIRPLMPRVEKLLQEERQWIQSMLESKARLMSARQNWKLGFNRLLKLLNTFEYDKVREIQEPVLEVYPRGNRGPDYDVQVRDVEAVFRKLLEEQEMPPEIRSGIEFMQRAGQEVMQLWDLHESVRNGKERMLQEQDIQKAEVNAALQRIEKKLKKLFPYEQRYLQSFFYK